MKTLFSLCAVLLLLLSLTLVACKANEPLPDPLEPIGPVNAINDSDDVASSAFVGTFVNRYSALFASSASDVFTDEEHTPFIVCQADGTFSLTVVRDMSDLSLRTLFGTYTVSGDTAVFEAEDSGTIFQFSLSFASPDELRFTGEPIDCVSQGDLFERV